MKDRIKSYLADGLKPAQITSILGCSAGYISQLLKDETFKAEVMLQAEENPRLPDEKLESKYESLEHQIINEMMNQVSGQELPVLTRALDSVVKARDMKHVQRNPTARQPLVNVNIVSLQLPPHAVKQPVIHMNEQREVIAIGENALAPMNSDRVKNLFQDIKERRSAFSDSTPVAIAQSF